MSGAPQGSFPIYPDGSTPVTSVDLENAIKNIPTGQVALGSRFRRQKAIHPLPGASPAVLTSDGGLAAGGVSATTGLKFIPWSNLEAFNYQGMFMQAAVSQVTDAASQSAGALGINACTPRKFNYGTFSNEFLGGTIDFRFLTDSTRVIPQWFHWADYIGSNYQDCHVMVEHEGEMKHLSSNNTTADGLPRSATSGSGFKRRELQFLDRREKEIRVMLPGPSFLQGVWIDTKATIRKPPNKDLFMHNGDSWNEPMGASFSDNPGGGFPSGSYMCLGMPQWLSFETGQAHGTYAQGGTGRWNGGVSGSDSSTYTGTGNSSMWTDARVNDALTKFGPQFPIELAIGSWNDGDRPGTPYKANYKAREIARDTKLFSRSIAAGRDFKLIDIGIQPADWTPGDGGFRDLSEQGLAEVPAAMEALYPGMHLGYGSIKNMWDNKGTGGQRSILCLSQSGIYIHLNVSGYQSVCGYLAAIIGSIKCPTNYLEKQRSWNV